MLVEVCLTAIPHTDLQASAPAEDEVAVAEPYVVGKLAVVAIRLKRGVGELRDTNDGDTRSRKIDRRERPPVPICRKGSNRTRWSLLAQNRRIGERDTTLDEKAR